MAQQLLMRLPTGELVLLYLCIHKLTEVVGDIAAAYADPALAAKELEWKAELGLDRICEDAWRWQVTNPKGYGENMTGASHKPCNSCECRVQGSQRHTKNKIVKVCSVRVCGNNFEYTRSIAYQDSLLRLALMV